MSDEARAEELRKLRFGMFLTWSFSSFSGVEWTKGVYDIDFFAVSGLDTDQWCQTAKAAGMTHVLFLTKHHDGFCLWDTKTTDFKVTNTALGKDVLLELRRSCDPLGIKLALYFSDGDWTWIRGEVPENGPLRGADAQGDVWLSSNNPEMKKAQLEELFTEYGPIEYVWLDPAQGDGGLDGAATATWIHQFQPNAFVRAGNVGRLDGWERGRPHSAPAGRVAEFTYPIVPFRADGAKWFYPGPAHDDLVFPAEKLFKDLDSARAHESIFDICVGPRPDGKLRPADILTLLDVPRFEAGTLTMPTPVRVVSASSNYAGGGARHDPMNALDHDQSTYMEKTAPNPGVAVHIEADLGTQQTISRILIDEGGRKDDLRNAKIEVKEGTAWREVVSVDKASAYRYVSFPAPTTGRYFRLVWPAGAGSSPLTELQFFADP